MLTSCRKAAEAGTLKRFILTSSVAAVVDLSKPLDYVFAEDDWNESASTNECVCGPLDGRIRAICGCSGMLTLRL